MSREKYESIIEHFKIYFPDTYPHMVEWWESGPMSVFIRFDDGSVSEYNKYDDSLREIRDTDIDTPSARSIGHNLQKLIQLSGMTQTEIASRIGVTNAMMSRYTHGTSIPSGDKLYRIARLIGCSVDEFFDGHYMK